jgi:hypothetical protein
MDEVFSLVIVGPLDALDLLELFLTGPLWLGDDDRNGIRFVIIEVLLLERISLGVGHLHRLCPPPGAAELPSFVCTNAPFGTFRTQFSPFATHGAS